MEFDLNSLQFWIALGVVAVVGVMLLVATELSRIFLTERVIRKARERLDAEHTTLRGRAAQLESLIAEIDRLNQELTKANDAKDKLEKQAKRMNLSPIQFIHEIARKEPGNHLFRFSVKPVGDWDRKPPERIVFHPMVWKYRNTVHIWAQEYAAAQYLVGSMFNETSGVSLGDPVEEAVPLPLGLDLPADADGEASEAGPHGRAGEESPADSPHPSGSTPA